MKINQKHLANAISELEKWYVTSIVELVKLPVFNELIENELTDATLDKVKREELERMLESNKKQATAHTESMSNLEQILGELYKKRKRFIFF